MDFKSDKLAVIAKTKDLVNPSEIVDEPVYFTATEHQDEKELFKTLNGRLAKLEASLAMDQQELESIRQTLAGFRLHFEEQKEIKLRVEWIKRLYEVYGTFESVKAMGAKEINENLWKLRSVQSCPLKNELIAKLKVLDKELKDDSMIMALQEAGEEFKNLGKTGREFILYEVEEEASMEVIRKLSMELEVSVRRLKSLKTIEELLHHLEKIPLKSYQNLTFERKRVVAEHLLIHKEWNGLASLDHSIEQIRRQIVEKETVLKETILAAEMGKYMKTESEEPSENIKFK